jgi:hypothetical protein
MSLSAGGTLLPGIVKTTITNGRGHDPQTWARMARNTIISVSDTAPMPIREQAHAFAERVEAVIAKTLSDALHEQLTYLAHDLERAGMHEAATMVRGRFHQRDT